MKRIYFIIFMSLTILYFACNPRSKTETIYGKWKVTDMKVEMPNIHPQLITNAKILALSTTYEFKSDLKYCMTISDNELESGRKHMGSMVFNSNNLSLSTDSLLIEKDGIWTAIEKNDFNKPYFKIMEMKIDRITNNQLLISEKEVNGIIYYTLDRID